MQAVILAAGRGRRFGDLTLTVPKPLVTVAGKPLIGHVFSALPQAIVECVIVIDYLGENIRAWCNTHCGRIRIRYVRQEKIGTGGALLSAQRLIGENGLFLVVGGDDIFGAGELDKLIGRQPAYGIHYGLPTRASNSRIVFDERNILRGFAPVSSLAAPCHLGVGAYVLPYEFFSGRIICRNNELSLPHSLPGMGFEVKTVPIERWLPVNNQAEREAAERRLASDPGFA